MTGEPAWTGRASAPWFLVIAVAGAVLIALGAATAQWAPPAVGIVLVVVALITWRITVTVDAGGLTLRWGSIGWPSTNFPLERIERASEVDIRPVQWGGWGYRGSVTVFGKAAAVLRRGPGIRLDLARGKVFAVTVDDAAGGVDTLNRLLAQRHG